MDQTERRHKNNRIKLMRLSFLYDYPAGSRLLKYFVAALVIQSRMDIETD